MALLLAGTLLTAAPAPVKFSGEEALRQTARLVALGPRPSGSEAHRKMQAVILGELRQYGCVAEQDAWTASTPAGPRAMRNIVVRIPGASSNPVVISGHYDTKELPGFVGANDGGSSAGLLLELARVLCKKKGPNPVWLVWLDGEEAVRDWTSEDSLYGSRRLAAQWRADGTAKKIRALINVDMIGDKDLNILSEYNSSRQLRGIVWEAARELGHGKYFTSTEGAIEDDHIPFGKAGIPSLDLIDFDYGMWNMNWHSERDTVDKLSARSFQIVGEVLLRTLEKLGGK